MYPKKILSSVLSLAMAGVMIVPAFSAGTTAPNAVVELDSDGSTLGNYVATVNTAATDFGEITGSTSVTNPIYSVSFPTSLAFAIDAYETADNGMISCADYWAVNYSNVPIKLNAKFYLTEEDATNAPLVIKDEMDAVNGATADADYDVNNTKNEICVQIGACATDAINIVKNDGTTAAMEYTGSGTATITNSQGHKLYAEDAAGTDMKFPTVNTRDWPQGDYKVFPDSANASEKEAYPAEERVSITGKSKDEANTVNFYLEKGGNPSTKVAAKGMMTAIAKESALAFRFFGAVNPEAKWAKSDGSAVVGFKAIYNLNALNSTTESYVADLLSGAESHMYGQSNLPSTLTASASVKLGASEEAADGSTKTAIKIYPGSSDGEDTAATGVTKVVIKGLPASADEGTEKTDKELDAALYSYDASTGELKFDGVANQGWYINRTTKLVANKNGYDIEITMNDTAKTVLKGKIVFVTK